MNIETLDLLRESLPYIQKFQGKTFVVKFSGKVTEDAKKMSSLAEELALLHQVGIRICVVHGGGKQLSELAEKFGVDQTVIEGRRVTNDETLDLAKMIFSGKINTEILAALRQQPSIPSAFRYRRRCHHGRSAAAARYPEQADR